MVLIRQQRYDLLFYLTFFFSTFAPGAGMAQDVWKSKMTCLSGYIGDKRVEKIEIVLDSDDKDTVADYRERRVSVPVRNGYFKHIFQLSYPDDFVLLVNGKRYPEENTLIYFIEPGDSISFSINESSGEGIVLSGKGIDKSLVFEKMAVAAKSVRKPSYLAFNRCKSLQDYLEFSDYIERSIQARLEVLDSNRERLSLNGYNFIKGNILASRERYRTVKFGALVSSSKKFNLSVSDLFNIFDTTLGKSQISKIDAETFRNSNQYLTYATSYATMQSGINRLNIEDSSSIASSGSDLVTIIQQKYKGLLRERILTYNILPSLIKLGKSNDSLLIATLNQYYSDPDYSQHKRYIRDLYLKTQTLIKGSKAPGFTLPTSTQEWIDLRDLRGKVVLMDFWFTGCSPCAGLVPVLKQVHELYKNNPEVVLLNISIDNRKTWLESIQKKIYTTGEGICAYTQGKGKDHPIVKNYLAGYPKLIVIGKDGSIFNDGIIQRDVATISNLINRALTAPDISISPISDPFVLYKEGLKRPQSVSITFPGNPKWNFTVPLKRTLANEPSEFDACDKIMSISDIEGEFGTFRNLLLSGHVIDESYNWTFGKGHLVLVGDFFDRGENVTETLWLIYKLEEEAKRQGGYVHYILGNHEIMNMSGDFRYVNDKYFEISANSGIMYSEMYGRNSELGRWLGTKNIIERLGPNLFVHAGIHPAVNELKMQISDINDMVRPHYREALLLGKEVDSTLKLLYSNASPFWYRGWYNNSPVSQVNSCLMKFNVDHIITGHTIVDDTINCHFSNKIINIDVPHASGRSEALLIEDGRYYRIDNKGNKVLLFRSQCYTSKGQ